MKNKEASVNAATKEELKKETEVVWEADRRAREDGEDFDILDIVHKRLAIHAGGVATTVNAETEEEEFKEGTEVAMQETESKGIEKKEDFDILDMIRHQLAIHAGELATRAPEPPISMPGAYAYAPTSSSVESSQDDEERTADSLSVAYSMPASAIEQGLAHAVPVDEIESPLDLPRADAVDLDRVKQIGSEVPNLSKILAVCFLCGTALLSVVLTVVERNNRNGVLAEVTQPPAETLDPLDRPPRDSIKSLLPKDTLHIIQEAGSPQSLALSFCHEDPNVDTYPDWRIRQRFALASLYFATGGEHWTRKDHWLNYSVHECEWYQQPSFALKHVWEEELPGYLSDFDFPPMTPRCDPDGQYQHLWLDQNNLVGSIPLELYFLTSLQTVSFTMDEFDGTIPSHIGLLTQLEGLVMTNHKEPGIMPSELGILTKLRALFLNNNAFIGTVPTQLWTLSNLTTLAFHDNPTLQGIIPTGISDLSNLFFLSCYSTSLAGTIPSEIGLLDKLEWVVLLANQLTGSIPVTMEKLTNMKVLYLFENALSGEIPSEIGLLTNLIVASFRNNQFTGTIPSELGLLTNLAVTLNLSFNHLSGSIPTELGLLTSLHELDMQDNLLSGSIPSELGQFTRLGHLALANNSFEGTLPMELAWANQTMHTLSLGGNAFISGTIPDGLCTMNGTCINSLLDACDMTKQGLSFDCAGVLCGCDCPCT